MLKNSNSQDDDLIRNRAGFETLLSSGVRMDLHIHTCYSDGELTPEEVVDRWKAEGYGFISITDHDGIEGSIIGYEYARSSGIRFIPGIEFDSEDELGKDLHILGYGVDFNDEGFRSVLRDINRSRDERNARLLEALNRRGYGITPEDIAGINGGRYVGKPTFSRILYYKGFMKDFQEAFDTIYREDDIRVIRKETLSSRRVVDVIHEAGGVAVLAHPMEQRHLNESFRDFRPRLMKLLDTFTGYGIDGIECYHPSADSERAELLREYAEAQGLLITRGSDFHTDISPRDFSRYYGE